MAHAEVPEPSNMEVPEKTAIDLFLAFSKASLASVPRWWSASAAEVFGLVFSSPIEKRRDEYLEDVRLVLVDLVEKLGEAQVEKVVLRPEFVSAVMQGARIFVQTHQAEKREFLRNALLNIALGSSPGEDLEQIFLNAIEDFTPSHVHILDLLWRGQQQIRLAYAASSHISANHMWSSDEILQRFRPGLVGQSGLVTAVMLDLYSRGFSQTSQFQEIGSGHNLITSTGGRFLEFVLSKEQMDSPIASP